MGVEQDEPIVQTMGTEDVSIIVDKNELQLFLMSGNDVYRQYDISTGKNSGDKQKKGDCRTPVGKFKIFSIENSLTWEYDFEDDDYGPIKGAYGPYFLRLETPSWRGIGIHGTHNPDLIGFHNSHGCIRMRNKDLLDLVQFVTVNIPVEIRE